jgi:hypothetical protein
MDKRIAMNPDKNEIEIWKIIYKHIMKSDNCLFFNNNDPIEEQLTADNYAEANAELNRIMRVK